MSPTTSNLPAHWQRLGTATLRKLAEHLQELDTHDAGYEVDEVWAEIDAREFEGRERRGEMG